ncbi:hypothetical protein M0R45_035978 [Rubus argutus]|uniref:Uncharacterized protein n=1 Tax=Rubus argutus TaxID=59490 RepID=A0AAW1VUQ1_RUBAR
MWRVPISVGIWILREPNTDSAWQFGLWALIGPCGRRKRSSKDGAASWRSGGGDLGGSDLGYERRRRGLCEDRGDLGLESSGHGLRKAAASIDVGVVGMSTGSRKTRQRGLVLCFPVFLSFWFPSFSFFSSLQGQRARRGDWARGREDD